MYNQLQMAMLNQLTNGWVKVDSQDNAIATASKAAATGKTHIITGVFAGFSSAVTKLLQIKDGNTVIAEHYIVNTGYIPLNIRATDGNAVSATLEASGTAGQTGKVNLTGFTI